MSHSDLLPQDFLVEAFNSKAESEGYDWRKNEEVILLHEAKLNDKITERFRSQGWAFVDETYDSNTMLVD